MSVESTTNTPAEEVNNAPVENKAVNEAPTAEETAAPAEEEVVRRSSLFFIHWLLSVCS
jgi:hypothetical protein